MNLAYCRYLGNGVATIHNFGFNGINYPLKDTEIASTKEKVTKEINTYPNLDFVAITANFWQSHMIAYLKESGFRRIVTFKSSHEDDREYLTLWTKKGKDGGDKEIGELPVVGGPTNCSVGFNRYMQRCILTTSLEKMKELTDAKKVEYKKVRNFNLWYRIRETYIKQHPRI